MRIGKQDAPYYRHLHLGRTSITVRGKDLVGELIGKTDFTSYFWFLVTGQQPNEDQALLPQRGAGARSPSTGWCRAWSPRG